MEPSDLTIQILQDIRAELRAGREQTNQRLEDMTRRSEEHFELVNERFEVIETSLRDLAQQMVLLSRGIKGAISFITGQSTDQYCLPHTS